MQDRAIRTLLDTVRRRLWRDAGRLAVRRAAWLSAAAMLLAGAVHLAAVAVPVGAVLIAIGLLWLSLLAWVASRRPSDADGALWIDRQLGGASAFTTLLDTASPAPSPTQAPAVRWLEQWAAAKVPAVTRSLDEQTPPAQPAGALLSMAICAALTLFILTLPPAGPATQLQASAPSDSSRGDKTLPVVEAAATTRLASEISSALRSAEPHSEAQRPSSSSGSTGASAGSEDESATATASTSNPRSSTPQPSNTATAGDSRSVASAAGPATAEQGRSAGATSGRNAGDSADTHSSGVASRPPAGTMAATGSVSMAGPAAADRQADMDIAGAFAANGASSGDPGSGPALAAAAATPPPAVKTARLRPTEATYVQAWMKATGPSR